MGSHTRSTGISRWSAMRAVRHGFLGEVAGFEKCLDLLFLKWFHRRICWDPRSRYALHWILQTKLPAGPSEERGQADIDVVDRLGGEFLRIVAGNATRDIVRA